MIKLEVKWHTLLVFAPRMLQYELLESDFYFEEMNYIECVVFQ